MAITRIGNPAIADERGVNFRNIIINGDMSIAQRGTSTASVSSGATFPALDRFKFYVVSGGTWTVSQDTDVPSGQGFAKSLKMDNTTANGSLSSGSLAQIQQGIEGQNLQYLKKGTSNAESVTLSFWVKSNKTGTYICEIRDTDNSRSISKSYTVSSASTWEKKTITFDGDTTGTLNNDNDKSFELVWWLLGGTDFTSGTLATSWASQTNANRAVGQVNLADSTSNEWYITGVQLEAGQVASDFEFLPVDVNLERCKRYFQTKGTSLSPNAFTNNQTVAMGMARTVSSAQCYMELNPIMRSEPTVSGIGTLSNLKCHTATGGNVNTSSIGSDGTPNRQQVTYIANNLTSGLNDNQPLRLYGDYTITFDAEL
tara:strand:- start:214 stop:1326 length:1113 start_codon:yes stop_codon:yes gene_type:complete